MQRNEVITVLIQDIMQLAERVKQDDLYFELESQQFIGMIVGVLKRFEAISELSERNLAPLKRLLQMRMTELAKSSANFQCNQLGAGNVATLMLAEKLAPVINVRHPNWIFQIEGATECYFGEKVPTEKSDKLAAFIMKCCFESEPPAKKNAVKLAELLKKFAHGKWGDFFKCVGEPAQNPELAKQLCNALLEVHYDSYKIWQDKSGLFDSRITEGLQQIAHDPELARIYFFIFCELYYRLREQEPEFTSSVGGLFGRLNAVTKIVSTREDKLSAARMLQNFLTNERSSSLGDSIEQYFSRHQKSNLFAETQKDCLGKITGAIARWTELNREHRRQQQCSYAN